MLKPTMILVLLFLSFPVEATQEITLPPTVVWEEVVLHGDDIVVMGRDQRTRSGNTVVLKRYNAELEEVWESSLWTLRAPTLLATRSALVVYGDTVLLGVDPDNGERLWDVEHGDRHAFLLGIEEDSFYLYADGAIRHVNAADGKTLALWNVPESTLGSVHDGWVVGQHAVLKGSHGGTLQAVSIALKDGSTHKLYAHDGPEGGMLAMIFAEGARDSVAHGRRSPFGVAVLSDEEHLWLEAVTVQGQSAWTWRFSELKPEALVEKASTEEVLQFDYDQSLLVTSAPSEGGETLQLEAFRLADRSPSWTLEVKTPSSGRIAAFRELENGEIWFLLRGNAMDAWFFHALVSPEGELLWRPEAPLDYPDSAAYDGRRVITITAPFGPNSKAARAGEKRIQRLRIRGLGD